MTASGTGPAGDPVTVIGTLSPASVYTLGVQGGPMPAGEIAAFEARANEPTAVVPGFGHYADLLAGLARSGPEPTSLRRLQ